MYVGHQKDVWIHTAHLIATIINVNRGQDKDPVSFEDIYPFTEKKVNDEADDIEVIKAAWLAGVSNA